MTVHAALQETLWRRNPSARVGRALGIARRALVAGGPERGWVLGMQGEAARGSAQIRQGLAAPQGGGLQLLSPSFLAVLAEVSGQAEQPEAGLQVL